MLEPKRPHEPAEEALVLLAADRLVVERLGQLLEQLALMIVQTGRHDYPRHDDLVPATAAAQEGHALAAQSEGRPSLDAGRHLQPLDTIDGRRIDLGAKGGLGDIE